MCVFWGGGVIDQLCECPAVTVVKSCSESVGQLLSE